MITSLVAGVLWLIAQQGATQEKSFILSYQEGNLNDKTVDEILRCDTVEKLQPVLSRLGFVSKSTEDNLVFILPSNEKLEEYIRRKKELMDLFVSSGAGRRTEPLRKANRASDLSPYWYDQVTLDTMTAINGRIDKSTPLLFRLGCQLSLEFEGKQVSAYVAMYREVSKELANQLDGAAVLEGGVSRQEKYFPASLEEAVRDRPYTSFTLSGLRTKSWGVPLSNSTAAKAYEEYFSELKTRTEDAEKRLGKLHRDFLVALGTEDSLWKEFSELRGKPVHSSSELLQSLVINNIRAHQNNKPFPNDKELETFWAKAVVTKVRPVLGVCVRLINHTGSRTTFQRDF